MLSIGPINTFLQHEITNLFFSQKYQLIFKDFPGFLYDISKCGRKEIRKKAYL